MGEYIQTTGSRPWGTFVVQLQFEIRTVSRPALVASGGGTLDLVVRGFDNGIYHNHFTGSAWSGFIGPLGFTSDAPALAASGGGVVDLVVRGTDSGIYHNHFTGAWSGFVLLE